MFGSGTGTTATISTGNNNIDGMMTSNRWASNTVTYSFTDNFANDYESGYSNASTHSGSFQTFNTTQRAVMRNWAQAYYNVSNLILVEQTGAADRDATIRIAMSNDPPTGYAYTPHPSVEGGDIFFNRTTYNTPVIGNHAYRGLGHELGHALGLKHPHETTGVRNVAVNADRDSTEFSIMSYRSYVGAPTDGLKNETWGNPQSLMMNDIRAIQQKYGAWFGSNSTNTNYTFSTTTGEMFINGVGQGTPGGNRVFRTIWDGNGTDTYDFSNYSTNLAIDLTPGGWSDLAVGSNFQRANLDQFSTAHYARGHVFNALQYNGDVRSLIENANGGSGNDKITGNSANNVIRSGAGNDTVDGGAGNDTIYLGAGNDRVDISSTGDDKFYGEAGDDYLDGWSGNETYDGGTGNDTIYARGGNDTADGGDGNDIIYLGDGNDRVDITSTGDDKFYGEAGDDYLDGNTGNETYDGGAGNDTIYGRGGNDIISGGAGKDTMDGGSGIDTVDYSYWAGGGTYNLTTGLASFVGFFDEQMLNFENITTGAGADNITGSAAANVIKAGEGNDTVNGGDGNDIIYLGGGNDYVNIGSLGDDKFYGEAGDDYIDGYSGNETYDGGAGNDTLKGQGGNDIMNGGTGVDTIYGGDGNDIVDGGDGNDIIYLGAGNDRVDIYSLGDDKFYGEAGDDYIDGNTGNETFDGGAGNDTLYGRGGNDIMNGGIGVDTIYGGDGNDTVDGGDGNDIIYLGGGNDTVNITSLGDDKFYGEAGDDYIDGYSGNETYDGGAGNDTLLGYGGNDIMDGGIGIDKMTGGTGNDTYYIDNVSDTVTETSTVATEIDTVYSSITNTMVLNVERLTLTGTAAINGSGNSLSNIITGNSAANTLYGGAGNDTLNGGLGADKFLFNSKTHGVDSIDFKAVEGDKILISASGFGGGLVTGSAITASQLLVSGGSVATNASQRLIYNSGTGGLFFDLDGSGAGASVQFATLSTKPTTLATSSFVIA